MSLSNAASTVLHGFLLEQALAFGGNALLLTGPARVGKLGLARAVAAGQNCLGMRGMYGEGCGLCSSCLAEAQNNHPDVLLIEPKATTATGKTARRKLISIGAILAGRDKAKDYEVHVYEFLEMRPTYKRRVVILNGAEYLGPEAANALLKLVEEPPHGALFIFLAEDFRSVIPTIVSRSVRLGVPPAQDAALIALFKSQLNSQLKSQLNNQVELQAIEPELIEFATGRVGVLLEQEKVSAAIQDAQELNEALAKGLLSALEAAERLEKRFDTVWHPEALRFSWRARSAQQRAKADMALDQLQQALEAYVSPSLGFQVFVLKLREALGYG